MTDFVVTEFGCKSLTQINSPYQPLKQGQIRLKILASSINFRDILMWQGQYDPRLKLPYIPLSDGVGEIIEVASGESQFSIGDRVCPLFSPKWMNGKPTKEFIRCSLGGILAGTLRQTAVFDASSCILVPKYLSPVEASTLPCAALTAFNALCKASLSKSSQVLVIGTGGVSIFSLQFAKAMGMKVTVTSSSDEKLEKAKALGADVLINYREHPNWHRKVLEATGGVHAVIEVGGINTLAQSLKSLLPGGFAAIIGILSGGEGTINILPILMNSLRIEGLFVGNKVQFTEMNAFLKKHKIRPQIAQIYEFEDAQRALTDFQTQTHFGKVVIRGSSV